MAKVKPLDAKKFKKIADISEDMSAYSAKEMVASAKEYGCTCKGNGRIFKEKWLQAQSFSMQPLARKMQLFP